MRSAKPNYHSNGQRRWKNNSARKETLSRNERELDRANLGNIHDRGKSAYWLEADRRPPRAGTGPRARMIFTNYMHNLDMPLAPKC